MTKTQSFDQDGIFEIPRKLIHPDPDQPRVKVDDGLQASIDSEGIIQAITVRPHPELADEWMIVDGERRYLGGAHLKTIPCRIRLDLEDSVDRLITQLAANAGKPLTPIEEARAFKKALDADPKLTQAKLAERLGIPRSTIGDRIRLIEIHPAWMKLIESGKLQVSHAPLIHQYKPVPDEYQVKAAKNVADGQDWASRRFKDKDDVIPIADFRKILHSAFRDYVIRLDRVRAYKGPVLEIEEEDWTMSGRKLKKVKYAADIKLWRPIRNAAERRRRKENPGLYGSSGSSVSTTPRARPIDRAIKLLGDSVKTKKSSSWEIKPGPGEIEIYDDSGWARGMEPGVLSAQLDAGDLIIRESEGGAKKIFTTNARAVELAQGSFETKLFDELEPNIKKIRAKLTDEVLVQYHVSGPGARLILADLVSNQDEYNDRGAAALLPTIALALTQRSIPEADQFDWNSKAKDLLDAIKDIPDTDVEKIMAGLAAGFALNLNAADLAEQQRAITEQIAEAPFAIRGAGESPKSKKQQKRDARAAGKQVGDPARAKTAYDQHTEDVEADLQFEKEKELVEA